MHVKDLLSKRNRNVVTVGAKTPIADAARIMTESKIGAVIVVDANEEIAGILSERDILAAVGGGDSSFNHITTDELMTANVVTCGLDDPIIQVVIKLDTLGIRHIVVMDDRKMIGMLSVRDILEAFSRMIVEKRIFGQQKFATELALALLAA